MSRAEIARADLARIESMSDEDFAAEWGEWARRRDRDLGMVRDRWIADLRATVTYATEEELAAEELVAAKDAYRADPSPANRSRKALAVRNITEIREMERVGRIDPMTGRPAISIGGDAWSGVR